MATYNLQGKVLDKSTKLRVPYAVVKAYQVVTVAGGYNCNPVVQAYTDIHGQFNMTFSSPAPVPPNSNRPDIIFQVVQRIDGADRTIYDENPATQTRWNIADVLSVTLEASNCIAIAPTASGRPYDELFLFTRVGIIGVNQISTVGPGATGYAYPAPPATDNSANSPFGGTLDIAGWFGQFTDVVRYKIQYTADAGATWHDISEPLYNSYYDFAPSGGSWQTVALGPLPEGGQSNLYKLPYLEQPGHPWIFPDLLAKWDTTKRTDGLYTIRIQGFRKSGTNFIPAIMLIPDPSYGSLKLNIDNSPCVAKINSIALNTTNIPVCQIVEFDTQNLNVNIEASDSKGHLSYYTLAAMYGHNQSVVPIPPGGSDGYSNHIAGGLLWNGASVVVTYPGGGVGGYPPAKMPTCAYQFRLDVWKRTTNGYGLLYGAEDTWHITLKRP